MRPEQRTFGSLQGMNTTTLTSPFAPESADRQDPLDQYAPASHTAALLRSGAQYRRERMDAADMITTDEAAALAGTSRVTINAWIKSGRAVGLSHLRRGFKLPRWQFEPEIWPAVHALSQALGTTDGWQLLSFLESPSPALGGQSPRAALEQGSDVQRVLAMATAEAH